ncbi:hypothetical protein D6C85_03881 [Aureobasidium pullulans]|uniref:DNA polymerase delta subunit 3 n=1 Tax=Aureobasidium pullulans TaxID=5580 RepID=A0A4S9PXG3_AURPU|nr:hypothetical protein D6D04_00253 [Aureobasidium pullulans]THY75122.1 hypothetical protein D6C94_04293 [Aureobasidium pullulans]THZ43203.1 hypothetical protein D6C87_04444 [Aureobasidium pullulans]THZ73756.1 hypothetical protein D6C85_03881 [Aureobasidium pullulans]
MMASDYIEYLSANVLNDGQTVSYRTLSRALRVHSNLAKQMLYDFHHSQNTKKPTTLHATYLITGRKTISLEQAEDKAVESQHGPDKTMRSSPAPSSPTHNHDQPEIREYQATSILLVDQDHLDAAKSTFDQVLSIHVYSIQPGKLNVFPTPALHVHFTANAKQDLHVLTECNRAIMATAVNEDLLETSKQYGIIQNSQVKRRPMRAQKQPPPPNAAPANPAKSMFASSRPSAKETSKSSTSARSTPDSSQASTQASSKPAATKTAPLKREGSSLFKAFAKARPKADSQATESSAEASPALEPAVKEDEPMHDLSDEEADDEDAAMLDEGAITETGGKSKKEREEALRRMMDMEDEPMTDAPAKTPAAVTPEPAADESDAKSEPQKKEEPEEKVIVAGGRRRGRRRVMKKKTVQDEEGYLVTREEPGWESFSEEEPEPKKVKVAVAPPAAKNKKAAPKGQGNIMSFFSKK